MKVLAGRSYMVIPPPQQNKRPSSSTTQRLLISARIRLSSWTCGSQEKVLSLKKRRRFLHSDQGQLQVYYIRADFSNFVGAKTSTRSKDSLEEKQPHLRSDRWHFLAIYYEAIGVCSASSAIFDYTVLYLIRDFVCCFCEFTSLTPWQKRIWSFESPSMSRSSQPLPSVSLLISYSSLDVRLRADFKFLALFPLFLSTE